MPTPLRWDSGHHWDSGLIWDGMAPTTDTMPQNLVTLDISDADWTAIDAALTVLETKLAAKLVNLTIEERSQLNKMGPKSEPFCRETLVIARQNTGKLPPDAVTDLPFAEADLTGFDKLRPRLTRLTSLWELTDDTQMAQGSDIMEYCLYVYGILKALGASNAGLDTLRKQLAGRFTRGPHIASGGDS